MKRIATSAAALALALAACQQNDPNNITIDEGNSANAQIETLPPDETVTDEGNLGGDNADAPDANAAIPAKFQGRWGMVPADCTSTRGDAKGLIAVDGTTIKFYEATATLKEPRPSTAEGFSGLFSFTGEGQNWEKVQSLTLSGDTLKRAEDSGTFTYKRCA